MATTNSNKKKDDDTSSKSSDAPSHLLIHEQQHRPLFADCSGNGPHAFGDRPSSSPLPAAAAFDHSRRSLLLGRQQQQAAASLPLLLLDVGKTWLFGVTGCLAFFLGFLYFNQESMLYMPETMGPSRANSNNPEGYRSPAEYNLPFEEHWIRCPDGVEIHSWLLLQPNETSEKRPTIVFFHGNAGNIGIRLPNAQLFYEQLHCNVLMVEYRGYGDSRGGPNVRPTEAGLKVDGLSALRFIQDHPKVDPKQIVLFGRSLGGAVAFYVAQQWQERSQSSSPKNSPPVQPIQAMIVENTFCSIDDMADLLFPILKPFKGPILRMHWNSKELAKDLEIPILYLAGEEDEIVPHSQMQELYVISKSGASKKAVFHTVAGGTHNDTWYVGGQAYWDAIKRFLQATSAVLPK